MSEKGIVIPTWALPLVVSLFVGAVSYGAAQANAQATQEDVERVEKVVEKVVQETNNNTQKTALNEQAIQQIADGLSRQVEISQATDEKLGTLIELMLKERR
tara:strand:- start:826 stop:1131 length:306 start_codon:yes stop_codon:yes gene_type:complete